MLVGKAVRVEGMGMMLVAEVMRVVGDSECGSDRICVDGETGLPDMDSFYSSTLNKGHRTWQTLPFPNDKANWEI